MFDATSPSDDRERPSAEDAARLAPVRARGRVGLAFEAGPHGTVARRIGESENYRVRMPRVAGRCEAVLINTGGGMAGGDTLAVDVMAADGAAAVVTTPAAERIYRSLGPETSVDVALRVGRGACIAWLPQETILYSGARLRRTLTASVDAGAGLLLAEMVVFGRRAMGERLGPGLFVDNWRIERAGRLAFAEAVRLDGELGGLLDRPAVAGGAGAMATLLYMAPDAEDRLEAVRAALGQGPDGAALAFLPPGGGGQEGGMAEQQRLGFPPPGASRHPPHQGGGEDGERGGRISSPSPRERGEGMRAAVSAWNGQLVLRSLADGSAAVRADIAAAARALIGAAMPRVWGA